jgi:hypothetical protein
LTRTVNIPAEVMEQVEADAVRLDTDRDDAAAEGDCLKLSRGFLSLVVDEGAKSGLIPRGACFVHSLSISNLRPES